MKKRMTKAELTDCVQKHTSAIYQDANRFTPVNEMKFIDGILQWCVQYYNNRQELHADTKAAREIKRKKAVAELLLRRN